MLGPVIWIFLVAFGYLPNFPMLEIICSKNDILLPAVVVLRSTGVTACASSSPVIFLSTSFPFSSKLRERIILSFVSDSRNATVSSFSKM